ncbi:MAG: TIGR01777 family protein [Gemmatimonadetes bacterium]|nr:TIGR01777 family protein [Gemmatimonadota bacterium]
MKVFLTGATGFIGTALVRSLAERGDECVVLSRGDRNPWPELRVRVVRGNPTSAGPWEKEVDGADVVINLTGERIVDPPHRWTEERKRRLRTSRIDSTRNVAAAVRLARKPPQVLLSGSAIGFYGARGDIIADESTPAGTDFLARLAVDWEAAALEAETATRVVLLRSGVVLGKGDGGLSPLITLFKLGIGGPWGDGRQWWSWIHLADEIRLIRYAIDHPLSGPINLTAPNPVTVDDFAAAMGRTLNRPAALHVPEFALRLALGEAADALLNLQRVVPKRALETGYQFRFATIDKALADIFSPHS